MLKEVTYSCTSFCDLHELNFNGDIRQIGGDGHKEAVDAVPLAAAVLDAVAGIEGDIECGQGDRHSSGQRGERDGSTERGRAGHSFGLRVRVDHVVRLLSLNL